MALPLASSDTTAQPALDQTNGPLAASGGQQTGGMARWLSNMILASLLLAGFGGAYLTYSLTRQSLQQEASAALRDFARVQRDDVQGAFALTQEAMHGLASHLQWVSGLDGFDALAAQMARRQPSVLAVAWLRPLDRGNDVSLPGMPKVTEKNWLGEFVPVAARQGYMPMARLFLNPAEQLPAQQWGRYVGFDFASQDEWRGKLDQARSTGQVQVSYQGLSSADALLFQAVFEPVSEAGRQAPVLKGVLLVSVSLPSVMAKALTKDGRQLAGMRVFDQADPSGMRLLFPQAGQAGVLPQDADASQWTLSRLLTERQALEVLGRPWLIEAQPTADFLRERSSTLPLLLAAIVLAGALMLFAYLAAMRTRQARIEKLVALRTDELKVAFQKVQEADLFAMQSEKMSSIGQMVAGVAHEINTPLGFVSSNLQMMGELSAQLVGHLQRQESLLEQFKQWPNLSAEERKQWQAALLGSHDELVQLREGGAVQDINSVVHESAVGLERIDEIVKSLKDFSRVDRAQSDAVNLHQCIDSTLVIAHNTIKHHAQVEKAYGDLPLIRCNPSQINQVILNLLTNAAQAMPDDKLGNIILTTRREGEDVCLEVTDDGAGIEPEALGKIFDAFFTTKGSGEGTGLGLAICQKIVQAHGGSLTVRSRVGVGSTFTLRLPIAGIPDAGLAALPINLQA